MVASASSGGIDMGARVRSTALGAVHANLVVAAGATAVACTTILLADVPVGPLPLAFVFVAAWFSYTANRFTDRAEDARNLPARARFVDRYGRGMLAAAGIAYATFVGLTAVARPALLPLVLIPPVGVLIYASRLARRVFLVKNLLVGLVWAMIPFGLGLYVGSPTDGRVLALTGLVCWHITVAAAVFDVKDVHGDRTIGSLTLPVLVGPRRATWITGMAALLMLLPVAAAAGSFGIEFLALGWYPIHLVAASVYADVDRSPLFYGLAIDGEHLVVAGLAVLLTVV